MRVAILDRGLCIAAISVVLTILPGASRAGATQSGISYNQAQATPPATLARRLLGRTLAATIDRVEVSRSFFGGFDGIALLEPATGRGAWLCVRRMHWARVTPMRPGASTQSGRTPMRVESIRSYGVIGIAGPRGTCPAASRSYAAFDNTPDSPPAVGTGDRPITTIRMPPEAQMEAVLATLAEARAAAGRSGPLPFQVNCRVPLSEGAPDLWCREGGRRELARLTFENLGMIHAVWTSNCDRTVFNYEGGPCPARPDEPPVLLGWEIELPESAGAWTWMIGIGAGARANVVEMQADYIIYH